MTDNESKSAPATEPAVTNEPESGASEQATALFGGRAREEVKPQPENVTELPAATLIAAEPAEPTDPGHS